MQKLKALFILVRLPNLGFIVLTQLLTWYCIVKPAVLLAHQTLVLDSLWLTLLACSTLFIAAAGYMINDYFDIGIDMINKPERVTIERVFKRRSVITWHIILNVIALVIAAYIAWKFVLLRVILIQLFSILLLLWYSVTLKRQLVSGNLAIALLTSLTLLSIAVYEPGFPLFDFSFEHVRLFWLFILFAFQLTWAREVVKDIEDIKGDGMRDCRTIPLVWGVQAAKNLVYGISTSLLLILLIEGYLQWSSRPGLLLYWLVFLCLPLVFVLIKLGSAIHSTRFHSISRWLKWITLAGILSMIMI